MALKTLPMKLRPAMRTNPSLLLLYLALATANAIVAATQHSPSAPSPTATSSSNASYDTAGNPDYYTFDLGTTSSGTAGGEVYVVCVSPWAPFVFYNSTSNTLRGYEWDLFLDVSQAMGLSFDARVMGWNEMMHGLTLDRSDPNHCDIAPSAIAMTPDRLSLTGPKKLQFSVPTFHSGYGIITAVTWAESDMWSFGRVFTVQLWAVLLGTAGVLALLTFAAEHDYAKRGLGKTKYPTAFRPGMYEALYNCVGKLFNVVQDLKVTSLSGKLISMGWGFLVLVAGTTYTAGITATLTSANFKTTISRAADLTHYRVITYTPVDRVFLRFGFKAKGMPWVTEADGDAMLDAVATGAADALVIDYPWAQHMLATRCNLALVGQPFHYIDNAVGFNTNLNKSFVDEYNFHLMTMKQGGTFEEYQNKYFKASECPSLVTPQVVATLDQLKGLWIILGSFVGLAIILLILPRISSRFDADIKRSNSMFSMRRLGKRIARLAGRRSRPDSGIPVSRMTKGVEGSQSFGQGVAASIVRSTSHHLHLGEHSPGQLKLSLPGEVPEPQAAVGSAVAPKAQDTDSVVPFSSDASSSGESYPGAGLHVDTGAPMLSSSASERSSASADPTHALPSPQMMPKPSRAFLQGAQLDP